MMHTVQYVTIFPLGVGRRWANIAQAGWVSTDLRHYRLLVLRRALPSIHSEAILAILNTPTHTVAGRRPSRVRGSETESRLERFC